MIEILTASALATVQDLGRHGQYRHGVGTAGAMDAFALTIGNVLLGNPADAAGIEIPVTPFRLRFQTDLCFALTGADCGADLDGMPLPPDWAMQARAGLVLTLGRAIGGCRAYLCLQGGVDVPEVLGSRSTQLREGFGGHEGRALRQGDILRAIGGEVTLPRGGLGALAPADAATATIRVLPAAEYDSFTPAAQEQFWDQPWMVTAQSNRAGYRLSGPALELHAARELRSHGVVPGVIQVPPGGQPIIQLSDAATMGGYPKIGTVIGADLWRLGQVRPGEAIRFAQVDHATAVAAQKALEAHCAAIAATAAFQRGAYGRMGQ